MMHTLITTHLAAAAPEYDTLNPVSSNAYAAMQAGHLGRSARIVTGIAHWSSAAIRRHTCAGAAGDDGARDEPGPGSASGAGAATALRAQQCMRISVPGFDTFAAARSHTTVPVGP